jgi:hypothetical protein
VAGTVTPSSGSGSLQSFTVTASTAVSPSDLTTLSMQFLPTTDLGGCHVVYNRTAGAIGLYSDTGSTLNTKPIGSSATLANSSCAVGYSVVNTSGGTVSLTLILVFSSPQFSGPRQIQINAANPYGASGWQSRGTWTVP